MIVFDADAIQSLLEALDRQLAARGTTADIYLVGGAAIALSFDATRTTRDLDAVFAPTSEVRDAARNVADQLGLAEDWLNDAVKDSSRREPTPTSELCSSPRTCGSAWPAPSTYWP